MFDKRVTLGLEVKGHQLHEVFTSCHILWAILRYSTVNVCKGLTRVHCRVTVMLPFGGEVKTMGADPDSRDAMPLKSIKPTQ